MVRWAVDGAGRDDASVGDAVVVARALVADALARERHSPRGVRARRDRVARLVRNPRAAEFSLALTDQVARIAGDARAARRFAELVRTSDLRGLPPADRLLLAAAAPVAERSPGIVMGAVRRRLRGESRDVILPAEDPAFARHVACRRAQGVRVNVNVLGEAILGDAEARARLGRVLALLGRPDVEYVSVKISSIYPNVSSLAFARTVAGVGDRMRELYRAAAAHAPAKFVNLDMEEYRDLELTTAVFRGVLGEPEFRGLEAGVVLQAYLPDSHAEARALAEWARERRAAGGAGIKVRLVKGANLAMERVDAEMHGWPLPTYPSKADVDASYKALLELLLDPRYDGAVRVGLASHNLFSTWRGASCVGGSWRGAGSRRGWSSRCWRAWRPLRPPRRATAPGAC